MKTLIFCLLLSSVAMAQETLDYTGQTLTGTLTGGTQPEPILQITGNIVLAQALNPNEANQVVTPESYYFVNPLLSNLVITNVDGAPPDTFVFSTANGQITNWAVSLYAAGGAFADALTLKPTGDLYWSPFQNGYCNGNHDCGMFVGTNNVGGVWVDPPAKMTAPEMDWRNAAQALVLLAGIVVVVMSRRIVT